MKGITLIEIIVAIAILVIILAIALPVSWNFYFDYELYAERDELVSLFQRARTFSMANRNQSSHGVYISAEDFIIFEGANFLSSDPLEHQAFPRTKGITINGPQEIVFTPLSGNTSLATYNISDGRKNLSVEVNQEGMIEF